MRPHRDVARLRRRAAAVARLRGSGEQSHPNSRHVPRLDGRTGRTELRPCDVEVAETGGQRSLDWLRERTGDRLWSGKPLSRVTPVPHPELPTAIAAPIEIVAKLPCESSRRGERHGVGAAKADAERRAGRPEWQTWIVGGQ